MNFVKTTIIGGLIFLVPFVALVMVLSKAWDLMLTVSEPMAEFIPVDYIGGIAIANLLAVAAIVLLCFLAGLASRSSLARSLEEKLESALLMRIPGYSFLKGMTSSLSDEQTAHLKPVLVSFGFAERVVWRWSA